MVRTKNFRMWQSQLTGYFLDAPYMFIRWSQATNSVSKNQLAQAIKYAIIFDNEISDTDIEDIEAAWLELRNFAMEFNEALSQEAMHNE